MRTEDEMKEKLEELLELQYDYTSNEAEAVKLRTEIVTLKWVLEKEE